MDVVFTDNGPGRDAGDKRMKSNRRRIEAMQGTLMKLIGQLETCKFILDDIKTLEQEDGKIA